MLRRDWNDLLTRHYTTFPHYSRVRAQQAQIREKKYKLMSIWEQKFPPYQEPFQNNLYYYLI